MQHNASQLFPPSCVLFTHRWARIAIRSERHNLKRGIQHVWLGKFPGCAGWSSAALAGLVFVGVSINLARILSIGGLPESAILLFLVANSRRKMDPRYYGYLWFRGTISLCATVPFAIADIAVLVWKTSGLYWIVPATLLSIIVAIYNA
jgi:hypothetical protein